MIAIKPEISDHVEFHCSNEEYETISGILDASKTNFSNIDFYLDNVTEACLENLNNIWAEAEEAPLIMKTDDFWKLSRIVSRTDTLNIEHLDVKQRKNVVDQMLNINSYKALSPETFRSAGTKYD